jgi:hypothetical protein
MQEEYIEILFERGGSFKNKYYYYYTENFDDLKNQKTKGRIQASKNSYSRIGKKNGESCAYREIKVDLAGYKSSRRDIKCSSWDKKVPGGI